MSTIPLPFDLQQRRLAFHMAINKHNTHSKSCEELIDYAPLKKNIVIQEYVPQRVFKDKSLLCRIPIPFVIEEPSNMKSKVKSAKKVTRPKRRFMDFSYHRKTSSQTSVYDSGKTPINQFLSYQLSEEINYGIRDAKMLADQIKQIKVEKMREILEKQQKKAAKRIRIRPTNFKKKFNISVPDLKHLRSTVSGAH